MVFRTTTATLLILTMLISYSACTRTDTTSSNNSGVPSSNNKVTPSAKSYSGTASGNWSGQVTADQNPVPVNGTFTVTISTNGSVQGSFTGSYSGTAAGQVDVNGSLTATGLAAGGTTVYPTVWQGQVTPSVNSISIQGTLTGPYLTGTFSGTGPH